MFKLILVGSHVVVYEPPLCPHHSLVALFPIFQVKLQTKKVGRTQGEKKIFYLRKLPTHFSYLVNLYLPFYSFTATVFRVASRHSACVIISRAHIISSPRLSVSVSLYFRIGLENP